MDKETAKAINTLSVKLNEMMKKKEEESLKPLRQVLN